MRLGTIEAIIIIAMVTLGTLITKYLPFFVFKGARSKDSFINYLGETLPYAAVGLLVIYCLKDVSFTTPSYGLAELIAIL